MIIAEFVHTAFILSKNQKEDKRMKNINKKFAKEDIDCLRFIVGKKLSSIKHDEFFWGNFSTSKVSFYVDSQIFQLRLKEESLDFLWGEEDVSVFSFQKCEEKDTNTIYIDEKAPKPLITKIDEIVKNIIIIEDTIKAFNQEGQFGQFTYVFGIIIKTENKEYCFWKENYFEDDIYIAKGQNPKENMPDIDSLWNDWAPGCYSENSRNYIEISKIVE